MGVSAAAARSASIRASRVLGSGFIVAGKGRDRARTGTGGGDRPSAEAGHGKARTNAQAPGPGRKVDQTRRTVVRTTATGRSGGGMASGFAPSDLAGTGRAIGQP